MMTLGRSSGRRDIGGGKEQKGEEGERGGICNKSQGQQPEHEGRRLSISRYWDASPTESAETILRKELGDESVSQGIPQAKNLELGEKKRKKNQGEKGTGNAFNTHRQWRKTGGEKKRGHAKGRRTDRLDR